MAKMRQSLVPVILLATVALSSSNVLPIMSINHLDTEPLGFNSPNDNTYRDNRNILNDLFYKISIGTSLDDRQPKVQKLPDVKFVDFDNNRGEAEVDVLSKDDSYNGEGYRKEQWHNYPRQLDRLHSYLYGQHRTDKRNPDPGDPDIGDYEVVPETHRTNDVTTNEFEVYKDDGAQNIYDAVIANTNPFLILKIRLACLNNKFDNTDMTKADAALPDTETNFNDKDDKLYTNEINPSMDAVKVKREDINGSQNNFEEPVDGKRTVKKRLFSLWSRLQSLNHKGHELQHRRHLHAFYNLHDGDGNGNGILTAETRATLMRPPGSPLRWG